MVILIRIERIDESENIYHHIRDVKDLSIIDEDNLNILNQMGYVPLDYLSSGVENVEQSSNFNYFYIHIGIYDYDDYMDESFKNFLKPYRREYKLKNII